MAYGVEAISQVKVGLPSLPCIKFNEISNDELRRCELDFVDERMDGGPK